MPREGLLEVLANRRGCFISSLRSTSGMRETLQALQQIDGSEYDLKEWNDCLSYLSGGNVELVSKDEIAGYLEETLRALR